MSYKITNFDETTGLATVRFDGSDPIAVSVPIEDSKFITGNNLDLFIMGFKPTNIKQDLSGISNIDEIKALVQPEVDIHDNIVDKIKAIRNRRNFLLQQTDYTQLPDADLPADLKSRISVYRQELRDITNQDTFPNSVTWPTMPTVTTPVVILGSDITPLSNQGV